MWNEIPPAPFFKGGEKPVSSAGVTFLREGMKVRDLGDTLGGSPP
jgi:hypothetical protein